MFLTQGALSVESYNWTVSQYNDPVNHYSNNFCFPHVGEDVHFRFLPKESKDNYNNVEFS